MDEAKRAARRARDAARTAARKAQEDVWRARVDAHFGYLRERYSFRITRVDASSFWETRLVYETDTTAVCVDRSVEFDRVEATLIRLVRGQHPAYPIFITPDLTLHHFLVDWLLEERAPHLVTELRALRGLADEQIEGGLAFLAQVVDEYASDILRGDFSSFAALEQRVKQQMIGRQAITVYVPEGTSPEEAEQTAKDANRDWPTISAVVRMYRRSRRAGPKNKEHGAKSDASGASE